MALHWLVATVLVTNYFSYFISVLVVFRRPEHRQKFWFWVLVIGSATTWGVSLHEFVQAAPMAPLQLITLLAALLSCGLLFWWSAPYARRGRLTLAFSDDEPRVLVTKGPYRFVRHPFYLSYIVTYYAVAFLTGGRYSLYCAVVMNAVYVHAAWQEELKFSRSPLAAAYRDYWTKTGMFTPRILGG